MRNVFFRSVAFVLTLSVILILSPGCKSKKEEVKKAPAFKVLDIAGKKIPLYVDMVGQAVAIPTVNINARVEGYLQNWSFKEGSIVQKGQLLFTIEQDNFINNVNYQKADLDSKEAAWELAKLDVVRLKPLLATNAISQNDFDKAVTTEKQTRAAVESAKSSLDDAKLKLSYTTITSPITGMIGKVNVNPGNLVGHGEATLLTTVSAVDPMYVDFQMAETDYLRLTRYVTEHNIPIKTLEDTLRVYLTLSDKQPFPGVGHIDFMDRSIDPSTGTLAMRAVFANPKGLLKPGNYTQVNLVLGERDNGIIIPQSAYTQIQGKFFVFLVDKDNKVSREPVQLGRNIGNNVLVLSGLNPGDKILLEGFQKFQENMVVTPILVPDTFEIPKKL